MPTVPVLSRTRSFKLLVQGLGAGAGLNRDSVGEWGARTKQDRGPRLVLLSLLVLSPSVPFPGVPPAHLLPTPPPPGPPELRAEETQPKAEGSWREGDEVRLICYARGYPEPKLSWSQLGGSVRDPPLHPEPSGTLPKSLPPQRPKHCVTHPTPLRRPLPLHLCPHPSP